MSKLSSNFRYALNLIIVWLILSLIFSTISYLSAVAERENISFYLIFMPNLIRFGLWIILFYPIYKLTQKFDFQSTSHYWRNIFIHIFSCIFLTAFQFVSYTIISWLIHSTFRERYPDVLVYIQRSILGSFYLGLISYTLIVFASLAYLRNKRATEEKQKASLLQAQLVEAQLQALKTQLQPHFLFNTLNSISSLVLKNPPQAQTMIAKLGDFLRLTLDFNENQMVLLSEELRFLRSYLDIEQTRFSEKLQVIFNVNEEVLNAVVPHLALQPIVENSVKHGISQMTEGGKIEIIARKNEDKLFLQVKDNGPGKTISEDKNKTGLTNIQTRLKHLYGDDFSFAMNAATEQGMTVTIIIPLSFDFAAIEKNDK